MTQVVDDFRLKGREEDVVPINSSVSVHNKKRSGFRVGEWSSSARANVWRLYLKKKL